MWKRAVVNYKWISTSGTGTILSRGANHHLELAASLGGHVVRTERYSSALTLALRKSRVERANDQSRVKRYEAVTNLPFLPTQRIVRSVSQTSVTMAPAIKVIEQPSAVHDVKRVKMSGAAEAKQVLDKMLKANTEYASASPKPHRAVTPADREALAEGQWPKATIVACSDSRVPPELMFRASLGEIFVIRTAGNVTDDPAVLASIEFACANLGTKLVVILGHSKCGAIKAAITYKTDPEKVAGLADNLHGHVVKLSEKLDMSKCEGKEFSEQTAICVADHAKIAAERLVDASACLRGMQERDEILIVPAVYDIGTGVVTQV